MIFYSGLDSDIGQIQKNLDKGSSFEFLKISDLDEIEDLSKAGLFLVGPEVNNPVKSVQKIVAKDKHLSIVILADKTDYNLIKQVLNFSPFVGKNATCLVFNPDANYTEVFNLALGRTDQKRSFSKFNVATETKVSKLTSSIAKLETLGHSLEHAPIGVILLDQSGKIAGANKRSRQMFHHLEGDQIHLGMLFPEYLVLAIMKMIAEDSQQVLQTENVRGFYYEISSSNFNNETNDLSLLLINDITERKEKDERVEAILESLPQMAWTTSAEGKVNYYTHGWYNYTNQTPEKAIGEGWTSVIHPDDLTITISRWNESIRTGKVYQHAARFRKYDGDYRWHLSRAVPVYSGNKNISMWVGTSTDIHDQVLLAENLENKVRERTRSLEESNAELEQFAHVSSHDLQEPLRKIHTFAHLVKDNSYEALDESSRKYVDKIIGTTTRMSKLLKDLLSFTKLHHSEGIESVDLHSIIASIKEDLELAISQNKAIIKVGGLPVMAARPSQIKQLFYNLINNAIKFKKPDVPPIINIRARKVLPDLIARYPHLPKDHEYWEIVVKDNGIGFEQKYADQIFTIFQRLHGRSAYEGTGIGLAICRKVVSNHGGEIFAISSPGSGAAFHIILPERLQ